jgi:hypothetical protein
VSTAADCHHGWRGAPAEPIRTPCPACGLRALFVGSGGDLTCASVPSHGSPGCPSPGVEQTVDGLKARITTLETALNSLTEKTKAYMEYHSEKFYADLEPKPTGLWPAIEDARKSLGEERAT